MKRSTSFLLLAICLFALAFPFIITDQFVLRLAIISGLSIVLASAHNVLMKVGQLSLGVVAFYGLGAYVSAILTTRYDVPFLIAFFTAGIIATIAGWFIGRLTLKLRTAYFVLVTLGFAEFFRLIALNWIEMTNGPMGITAVVPPAPWFKGYVPYYYSILALVAVVLFVLYRMEYSTIGRAMRAIRENEPLAESIGISSYRYMMLAALVSSFIIGLAGSFYAHFFQFVGPEILGFGLTITIVVMVIAGGRATLLGPVVGAILFTALPEILRAAQVWRMAIYGLILMLMVLFMPDGIVPALGHFWQRLMQRRVRSAPSLALAGENQGVVNSDPEKLSASFFELSESIPEAVAATNPGELLNFGGSRKTMDGAVPETLMTVTNLCVYFGGVHAVEEVDFSVKKGEILAIIGPNGAGKTTILNAITRFGPITSGEIDYRDHTLNNLSSYEVARQGIVRTFQHTSLFPGVSTRDNLLLAHCGSEPEALQTNVLRTKSSVEATKRAQGIADDILRFIHLDSQANQLASSLPYGNQRLLELGIALTPQPELLLLDEPAAGMNPAEVIDLMGLIRRTRDSGITIVLVEHDMKLVMGISDRILVLDHGRKIAEGTPQEIRVNPQVVEAYLGRQN